MTILAGCLTFATSFHFHNQNRLRTAFSGAMAAKSASPMSDIHKKITAVRKRLFLSQPQAAELANIALRTYQRIESGETSPTMQHLECIAEGFRRSLDDILHFDLGTEQFPAERDAALKQAHQLLQEEVSQLRQMWNGMLDFLRGGGGGRKPEVK
ncbi:MAG: helix-turn-helix domain-containing protein [Saprospiraceae bacterium]